MIKFSLLQEFSKEIDFNLDNAYLVVTEPISNSTYRNRIHQYESKSDPHLVLFDLNAGGHHGQYIKQLAEYWTRNSYSGQLSVVITSQLVKRYPEILEFTDHCDRIEIRILPDFKKSGTLVQISKEQGRILSETLNEIKPTHCLLMDFDFFQLPLALGLRFNFPLFIYGIYFRPFLELGKRIKVRDGLARYIRYIRKRIIFTSTLRNPHLFCLFSLDPYFVEAYRSSKAQVLSLPDGIESQNPSSNALKIKLQIGVEDHRKLILFFGSIARRKGIFEVLDAIELLSSNDQERLCLAIAGKVTSEDQSVLVDRLDSLERHSGVQFIKELRFISDVEMSDLFTSSDLVLLPYLQHAGSSGVLIRAAVAGKPVLGSHEGLIGQYIRDYGLGLRVTSSHPSEIATGILKFLNSPEDFPFDADRVQDFATQHSAEGFSKTIFDQIYTAS